MIEQKDEELFEKWIRKWIKKSNLLIKTDPKSPDILILDYFDPRDLADFILKKIEKEIEAK